MTDQNLIIVFQYYNGNYPDVSKAFSDKGASSAIVLGGEFGVYAQKDFGDPHSNLQDGKYATATEMMIKNDTVQSIKKLQWTSCNSSGRFDDLLAQA